MIHTKNWNSWSTWKEMIIANLKMIHYAKNLKLITLMCMWAEMVFKHFLTFPWIFQGSACCMMSLQCCSLCPCVHALFYFTCGGREDVWGSLRVDMHMLKKLAQERRCKLVHTLDGHNWISVENVIAGGKMKQILCSDWLPQQES